MPDRLYLKPEALIKHSRFHTHYASDRPTRTNSTDPAPQLYRLEFINGVATNVPDELARRMEQEGIATRTRPRRREDE